MICRLLFQRLLSKHESIEPDEPKISPVQHHISGLETTWRKHSSMFSIYQAQQQTESCEIGRCRMALFNKLSVIILE